MTKKALIITYQVGCANHLIPIAQELKKSGVEIIICSSAQSTARWKDYDYNPHDLHQEMSSAEIDSIVQKEGPDLILTGSNNVYPFEYRFRVAGQKRQIPTYTILDCWANYRARFFWNEKLKENDQEYLPDTIFVTDQLAKDNLINVGIPEQSITIAGSPYFEYLKENFTVPEMAEGSLVDKTTHTKQKLLFLSQPIYDLYKEELGYNERTVISDLINVLQKAPTSRYELTIRPHPREDFAGLTHLVKNLSQQDNIHVSQDGDVNELIKNSDLIMGMSTNSLIEAAVIGKKTLSLQMGSNGSFSFFGTETKINPTLFDKNKLEEYFAAYMDTKGSKNETYDISHLYQNATANVLKQCRPYLY